MKANHWWRLAGLGAGLCVCGGIVLAQGGGGGGNFGGGGFNFDPAQFQQQLQQRNMEKYREDMAVGDEDEWGVIKARIQKVLDAKQATGFGGVSDMLGAFAGRGGQGGGGGRGNLGGILGTPSLEDEALKQAIAADASNAELKAAMARVQDARKAKQTKLEAAQEDLRKLLTVRREAIATAAGLL